MRKVIIFGFPHCGTTILRAIISHIPGVLDIVDECPFVEEQDLQQQPQKEEQVEEQQEPIVEQEPTEEQEQKKQVEEPEFVVCKWPFLLHERELLEQYADYTKIFILRNPLYVFTSMNRRMSEFDGNHSAEKFVATARAFLRYQQQPEIVPNLHLIRYEDMFDDNFAALKQLFNRVGFRFDDAIFQNENYRNRSQCVGDMDIPTEKPPDNKVNECRLYQVNQPFRNNNKPDKIVLLRDQYELLLDSISVRTLFPEVVELSAQLL